MTSMAGQSQRAWADVGGKKAKYRISAMTTTVSSLPIMSYVNLKSNVKLH